MIRATTPTHVFNIPFDTSLIDKLLVTYSQRRKPVVERTENECVFNGKTIALTLTQAETIKFSDRRPVEIQLRVLTTDKTALAGNISEIEIERILDDRILGDDPHVPPTDIIEDEELLNSCCCSFDVDFGEISIIEAGDMPPGYEGIYSGGFEFIPSIEADQIIETGNMYLEHDITIGKIPYAEVTNLSNGLTVTIG